MDDIFHRSDATSASPHGVPVALPAVESGVSLWWTDLAHPQEEIARISAWLSDAEIERASRFGTPLLRQRYIAGRGTLRGLLAQVIGVAPAQVPLRRGARGRPQLAETAPAVDFNVSHTLGGAVIAIATDLPPGVRVGVDVEREDRQLGADRLARKFLTAREQATLPEDDADERRHRFLRYWTCKEAMSKATGDGLGAPFAQLDVDIGASLVLVDGPPPYLPATWRLHPIAAPTGFFATLAIWDAWSGLTPSRRQ